MTDLIVTPALNPEPNKLRDAYEVVQDLATKTGKTTIRVPKFFQYDGASIPGLFQPLIGTPFTPRFMRASVFHDWIYHTHQISRDAADNLFHDLLIDDGVDAPKAWAMWNAVSIGGGNYWTNDPDDKKYIAGLTQRIVADKRNPKDYGLPPLP